MDDQKANLLGMFKAFLTWIAALLGVGTLLGFINLVVGLVSAFWVLIQLMDYIRYKRPVLKAEYEKLKGVQA